MHLKVKHNTRAIYQFYMGFYDGNPTTLDQLPPEEAAKKYVDYMGGAAAVLQRAKADFDRGEYRWVAEALKQIVFADSQNGLAKELLADTYEQLGYQSEAGTWRSAYLQGANELRNGLPSAGKIETAGPDTIRAMPPAMTFDYLAVQLNPEKAAGKKLSLGMDFTDLSESYLLTVENSVLNYSKKQGAADAHLAMTKATFDRLQTGELTAEKAISSGAIRVDGRREALSEFVGLFEKPPFWFNIVTP